MENCKKCNKNFKSISGLCTHLKKEHNLSFKEYLKEILDIPLCPYCNNKLLEISNRPEVQKFRTGFYWKKTCGSSECIHKFLTKIQNDYQKTEKAKISNEKIRKSRFKYLKKKTGKTAWERKNNGEMSFLEEWFFNECIRDWAKITGISEWTIRHRLDKGMSPENILKKQ